MCMPVQPIVSSCSSPWTVEYVGCGGKVQTKVFSTKEEAEANIAQHRTGSLRPPIDFQLQRPTVPASSCGQPMPPVVQSQCAPTAFTVQYQGCHGQTKAKSFPTREAALANIAQFRTGVLLESNCYTPPRPANKYC
jgi:predicted DNA-binding WGR domain protein